MTPRIAPLIAELLVAFISPDAQKRGVSFPADLTALWAAALRDLQADVLALEMNFARVRAERDQLLSIAQDADLIAGSHRHAPTGMSATVIDLTPILAREWKNRARPAPEGGAA